MRRLHLQMTMSWITYPCLVTVTFRHFPDQLTSDFIPELVEKHFGEVRTGRHRPMLESHLVAREPEIVAALLS